MIRIRRADERGLADFGWLKSRHSFSFGHYYDPAHLGHGPLRVINEDRVEGGRGFGEHGHADMEILSWVLEGALTHQDSLGHVARIEPGELQCMSAGTGVVHSEFNASQDAPVHFLQIWIQPERKGLRPSYDQRRFSDERLQDRLCLVASSDGRAESLRVHQDVALYVARLRAGKGLAYRLAPNRLGWLQLARGRAQLNGHALLAGDGAALTGESPLDLQADDDSELLLFDLTV